jgi:hypothetical protein
MDMKNCITVGVILGGGIFIVWLFMRNREYYGVMKNIRRVPFSECQNICEEYRNKCVRDFINADPSWCDRLLEACTAECYYAPYHPLQG